MNRTAALLALVLLSCNGQPAAPPPAQPLLVRAADDPGCVPGDGADDRACLNAKILAICDAGGGELDLDSGTWDNSRPAPVPGNADNASLWIPPGCHGLTIEGEGSATVIMMTGDGGGQDWSALRTSGSASGLRFANFTIASDSATGLQVQTHLLYLGARADTPGEVADVLLEGLHFRHPVRPEVAGDCLRLVGEDATPVQRVQGNDLVFESCDRSGVAFQRAARYVTLDHPDFLDIGKTPIDMEPSGPGSIDQIEIDHPRTRSHGISVAGQGNGGSPIWTTNVTIRDPQVVGRIGISYAKDVQIIGGTVTEVADSSEGTINVRGSSSVKLTGVTVRRLAGSVAGPAIKVSGLSGSFPGSLTIDGAIVEGAAEAHVSDVESVQDLTLSDSEIVYSGPTAGAWSGVKVTATGRNVDRLAIEGNRLRGPMRYAIQLAGSTSLMGTASVVGNQSSGAGAGLRCENPLKFAKPVVHAAFLYEGATAAVSGCTGATIVASHP